MAGDKTYITDSQGKQHRATRVHAVTPTDIVWSSNPNDYSVQVKIGGKWHRAILTMDAGASTFFENVNIDKALVVGSDGKNHTALIVKPESTATLSDIKTDEHALVSGTTTGETAVVTYSENWADVKYQDNVNVYKVLVTGSDGKVHTALLTTGSGGGGGVEAIVLGTSPLSLPGAIANSLQYVKAFGGTKQGLPNGYTQMNGITNGANTYVDTGIKPAVDDVEIELRVKPTAGSWYILQSRGSAIWGISGSSSGSTILLGWGGNSSVCQSVITRNATHIYYIKATIKNGLAVLYVKDETVGTEDTQPARYTSSLPPLPFWLYGNQNNDRVNAGNTVYMARIKIGGETVMDYVPAINASNVVGFYDKATGNFVVSSAGTLSTDQPAVPTPDAPMDIVCNNGVLKVRRQSGLPFGYTQLEYIASANGIGQYINTGIVPTINAKARVVFAPTNGAPTGYWGARNDPNRFCCTTFNSGAQFSVGMTVNSWPVNRTTCTLNTVYDCVMANGYANVDGTEYTETAVESFGNAGGFVLGGSASGQGLQYAAARFYVCQLWENNVLVFDGIPAKRNSDNALGMYDLVSGRFFTNAGAGDFVAGDPVSDPIEIYADGLVETINAHGKNLWDGKMYRGQLYQGRPYIGSNTEITSPFTSASVYSGIGLVVKVIPGQQYCFSSDATNVQYKYVGFYANREDVTDCTKIISYVASNTATAPAGANYAVFCCANATLGTEFSWTWAQAEQGSTATDYEPYYNGGTATCENLLSIGDYTDEQEVISGDVTRKVGVKVLDGTENWNYYSVAQGALFRTQIADSVSNAKETLGVLCNAYQVVASGLRESGTLTGSATNYDFINDDYTTVDAWKAYLADQYAAGTPVIIVYPLATETTESVAGQTLQVQAGDNTLEITQASLSGLELEAKYTKVV